MEINGNQTDAANPSKKAPCAVKKGTKVKSSVKNWTTNLKSNELVWGKLYYGQFYCKSCKVKWQSSETWKDSYQECRKCETKVFPTVQVINYLLLDESPRSQTGTNTNKKKIYQLGNLYQFWSLSK